MQTVHKPFVSYWKCFIICFVLHKKMHAPNEFFLSVKKLHPANTVRQIVELHARLTKLFRLDWCSSIYPYTTLYTDIVSNLIKLYEQACLCIDCIRYRKNTQYHKINQSKWEQFKVIPVKKNIRIHVLRLPGKNINFEKKKLLKNNRKTPNKHKKKQLWWNKKKHLPGQYKKQ